MFKVLEQNELLMPTRLLTGYIPGAESLSAVERITKKLKAEGPGLIYLLDREWEAFQCSSLLSNE
jgi:pyridoxine kinase